MSDTAIPATASTRGRLGQLGRTRHLEPEAFASAQVDLKAGKLRDAIQKAVESAPALRPAQIDALTALLNSAKEASK